MIMRNNLIVLVTGHRKSGTTMSVRLFDGCEKTITFPRDITLLYAYFPQSISWSKAEREVRLNTIFREKFSDLDGLRIPNTKVEFCHKTLLEIFIELQESSPPTSATNVFINFIKSWSIFTQPTTDQILIFKETSQACHFINFHSEIPNFKMVNVVRDPRDNFGAVKEGLNDYYKNIGESYYKAIGSFLFRCKQDLKIAGQLIDHANVENLRFEDLTQSGTYFRDRILKFLNLDLGVAEIIPTEFGVPVISNSFGPGNLKEVSARNVGNWGKRISEEEQCIIEFFLEAEIKNWGYQWSGVNTDHLESLSAFYPSMNSEIFYSDPFGD